MYFGMAFILRLCMKQPFSIKTKLEIEKNGSLFLNEKRVRLLRLIRDLGSINAATKEMKMSYQQAWSFIKEMNEMSPLPLVIRKRGGSNGGGAYLTKSGEKALEAYKQIAESQEALNKQIIEHVGCHFF